MYILIVVKDNKDSEVKSGQTGDICVIGHLDYIYNITRRLYNVRHSMHTAGTQKYLLYCTEGMGRDCLRE